MKRKIYYLGYLFRNVTVLNLILLTAVIIFSARLIPPMFGTGRLYTLPSIKKSAVPGKEQQFGLTIPSPSDFMIIADKNLFHPDRRIPPEKKVEEEKLLPKPDIVLYGTLITGDKSIAYLEDLKDPRNTPGRGKRQITMKKGDLISGFTLAEIHPDEIVLKRGKETMTVAVSASHKRTKIGLPAPPPSVRPAEPAKLPQGKERPARRAPRSQFETTIFNFLDTGKKR
jgi:hypothetical protein